MARPRNTRPSLIKRADGRQIVKIDGRQFTIGRPGDDEHDVEIRYADLLKRLAVQKPTERQVAAQSITFHQLIDVFLSSDESPRSIGQRIRYVQAHDLMGLCFRDIPSVADYDGEAQRTFKEWMRAENAGNKWKRSTINDYLYRVVRLMRFAHTRKYTSGDHMLEVQNVKPIRLGDAPESEEVQPVDRLHVAATMPYLPAEIRPLVELQLLTGARGGELLRLSMASIDRTATPWRYTPPWHKGTWRGGERTIYFGPQARRILTDASAGLAEADYLFSPARSREKFLESTRTGRPARRRVNDPQRAPRQHYCTGSYQQAILRSIRDMNIERVGDGVEPIPEWTSHQLRHRAATDIRSQMSEQHARAVLGHLMPGMTARYTVESDRRLAMEAMERMG